MLSCVNSLFAQKPVIDSTVYKIWPSLGGPTISNSGQYVSYLIENVPVGGKTLVVQSTDGKWKKEFKGGTLKDFNVILNNKYFLFAGNNDSLGVLVLGTDQIKYVPNVSKWNFRKIKDMEYLLYYSSYNPRDLILRNLKTSKERVFTSVDSWGFDLEVLVLFKSIPGTDHRQSINLANVATGKVSKIWEGYGQGNLILDVKHHQLAFKSGDSVWYYKFGLANAVCISDRKTFGIQPGLRLGYLESFSKDGKFIITSLVGKGEAIKPRNGVVEIWSYTDVRLQTEQENEVTEQKYVAVIDVEDRRLIRLQQQDREEFQLSKSGDDLAKIALVENPLMVNSIDTWNIGYKRNWDLVTLKNGNRKHLNFLLNERARLSPCGKYILYFDTRQQAYFSYEIATERLQNLTKGINVSWISIKGDDYPGGISRGIAGWLKNDEFVLVYDRYDIWKLDPLNIKKPVNLTNSFGKKNEMEFNLPFAQNINGDSRLYLTAFDKQSKKNGFFLKQLNKAGDPEFLHMGSYLYKTNAGSYIPMGSDFSPVKAEDAEMYIVRRMSATDAPNYFSTSDFKTFTRLSDLQPQRKYNWYTTELHSWNSLDGRKLQGVLYKPENFDPNKKYPVIFHYYERKSDGLHAYIKPEALCDMCNISIPTYVSNGYLVFTPDIYYKIGNPMQGTYDAVVSAANYLSTLPFVNSRKMGLQGCSFGGFETNYLITHTNLFAAAETSSGNSNLISSYGNLRGEYGFTGPSDQSYFEAGQGRLGGSLWEKPEAYIKNSPLFNVDKVSTPLLMMHTKKDPGCRFSDALEFFTGLRRMGKKAWMLVYSEGSHGIWGKEADDLSIRMMQFFDHYLKDKPAPLWMVDGVLAKDRSWGAGLELDTKGRTPGPGLLTPSEQAKADSLMTRKPITISLK